MSHKYLRWGYDRINEVHAAFDANRDAIEEIPVFGKPLVVADVAYDAVTDRLKQHFDKPPPEGRTPVGEPGPDGVSADRAGLTPPRWTETWGNERLGAENPSAMGPDAALRTPGWSESFGNERLGEEDLTPKPSEEPQPSEIGGGLAEDAPPAVEAGPQAAAETGSDAQAEPGA